VVLAPVSPVPSTIGAGTHRALLYYPVPGVSCRIRYSLRSGDGALPVTTEPTRNVLDVLIAKPVTSSQRVLEMEMFMFGDETEIINRHGKPRKHSEYSLHVQCPWRITASGRVIVQYADLLEPPRGVSERSFNPEHEPTRRDELLAGFFQDRATQPRMVVSTNTLSDGESRITLDDGALLELRPHEPDPLRPGGWKPDSEYWRIIRPDGLHIVVTGVGLYTVGPGESAKPNG
jgi:hypothetical protein